VSIETDELSSTVAAFDARGRMVVWGRRSGVVCVGWLDEINRRLTEVDLGWAPPTARQD
jgi:hypothetical protein